MRHTIRLMGVLAALLLIPLAVCAEEAPDITKKCRITCNGKSTTVTNMVDRKYTTYYTAAKGAALVADGKGQTLSGVWLQYYDRGTTTDIEALVDGEWVYVASCGERLSEYFDLPDGAEQVRITNTDKSRLFLA